LHGDIKLIQGSLDGVQRAGCCSSLRCLSAPICQEASQAARLPQRWIGHRLRFAFRSYSVLLKPCRPPGRSAPDATPSARASSCAQKSAGASLPDGRCRSSPISGHPSGNFATVMTVWLTAAEAAAHLKVRPRTLLLWVRQGRIPAHRLSGVRRCVWRFLRSELDAMLTSSSAGAAQEEAC